MKAQMILAVVLIVIGVAALGFGGFTWRSQEKVVDLGPVEVNRTKTHAVPIQPVLGGVALVGGVVLLLANRH